MWMGIERRNIARLTGFMSLLLGLSMALGTAPAWGDFRADMMKAADNKAGGNYVRTRFLKQMKKPFQANGGKKVLLIGDSHAQDFYNVILETGALKGYQLSTRYIPTVCQMYWGEEDISQYRDERHKTICAQADSLRQAKAQLMEADIVLLVSNWKLWSAQRLPQSIKNMQLSPQQKLVVLGRKNFGKVNVRQYMRMPEKQLRAWRNKVDAHQVEINQLMRRSIPAQHFVDVQKVLCGAEDRCPLFTPDLQLISYDGGHLTPAGAKYVGERLFSQSLLRGL